MTLLTAELSQDKNRIYVTFNFNLDTLNRVKSIPGAKFMPAEKGGPLWYFPKDLEIARALKRKFGKDLKTGPRLRDWGMKTIDQERKIAKLARQAHADLEVLPDRLPDLFESIYLGPKYREATDRQRRKAMRELPHGSYQTADVSFLAQADNPLNGLHPGLGKTMETIAAAFEGRWDEGPQLVVCPKTSIVTVWQKELETWQDHPVLVINTDHPNERMDILEAAQILYEEGEPFWLVINPAMIRYKGTYDEDEDGTRTLVETTPTHPVLFEIPWNCVYLDEIHKQGFRNLGTLTARALLDLKSDQRMALSGTPVGGKPINLWKILHWLHPDKFTSQWRWAEQWLVIEDKYHGKGQTHKEIGDIKPGLEDEFYDAHAQYFLRRTKAEVAPWLPEKHWMDLWAEMGDAQRKQYKQFALEAEVKIGDYSLSATSILAEYTRLKQFAVSLCDIEPLQEDKIRVIPTTTSCKLDVLEELLDELGVLEGSDAQVVIFSQFTQVCNMVHAWLTTTHKIQAELLTGDTKTQDRNRLQDDFQAHKFKVLVMNVQTGGVSITLDAADTVVFMDETWVPDDQEQAEDRCHRVSREHQVNIYTIRTKGTIEEYILTRLQGKANINKVILDLRRQGLRATG